MADSEPPTLPIHEMQERHRGLSDAAATFLVEALRVCLDRHHTPPTDFIIFTNGDTSSVTVAWESTDNTMRASHGNELDATRDGAYACALAAVELSQRLVAVTRAEHRSGADFYVAPAANTDNPQTWIRLEVSGTDRGDPTTIRNRLNEKLEQLRTGNVDTPGIACVVGFRAQLIQIAEQVSP